MNTKRIIVILLVLSLSFLLFADPEGDKAVASEDGIVTNLKDRDVSTIDLGEKGKDKLKLGLSLGYPATSVTAGWVLGNSLEWDFLVGSWNYDSLFLGSEFMVTLANIKIAEETFPLTAGPALYTGISNDFFGLSAGGVVRFEYTFDFDLNLYVQTGLLFNFFDQYDKHDLLGVPFNLGVRYCF